MENGWILVNNDERIINEIRTYLEKEGDKLKEQSKGFVLLTESKKPITTISTFSSDWRRTINSSTESSANSLYKTTSETFIIEDKYKLYSLILLTLKYKGILPIEVDVDYDISEELHLTEIDTRISSLESFKFLFERIRKASKTIVIVSKLFRMGENGDLDKEYIKKRTITKL